MARPSLTNIPYQGDKIRVQSGKAWYNAVWNGIKKVYQFAEDNKIASTAAAAVGRPGIAAALRMAGFKRPARRKTRMTTQVAGRKKTKESSVMRF